MSTRVCWAVNKSEEAQNQDGLCNAHDECAENNRLTYSWCFFFYTLSRLAPIFLPIATLHDTAYSWLQKKEEKKKNWFPIELWKSIGNSYHYREECMTKILKRKKKPCLYFQVNKRIVT